MSTSSDTFHSLVDKIIKEYQNAAQNIYVMTLLNTDEKMSWQYDESNSHIAYLINKWKNYYKNPSECPYSIEQLKERSKHPFWDWAHQSHFEDLRYKSQLKGGGINRKYKKRKRSLSKSKKI